MRCGRRAKERIYHKVMCKAAANGSRSLRFERDPMWSQFEVNRFGLRIRGSGYDVTWVHGALKAGLRRDGWRMHRGGFLDHPTTPATIHLGAPFAHPADDGRWLLDISIH